MISVVDEIRNDREKGAKRLESEYKAGLMSLARRFCSDESDAEELVNRTFAIVVKNIDSYLEQSAFFGWMSRILINCHSKDVRRKSHETVFCDGEIPADAPDDDACARVFREVDASLLRDAIERLPPDMKKTLMLHYFLDMPVREVARVLSVPSGTVMWRLHYTRQILGAKLGAQMKKPAVMLAAAGLFLLGSIAAVVGVVQSRAERDAQAEVEDERLATVETYEERFGVGGEAAAAGAADAKRHAEAGMAVAVTNVTQAARPCSEIFDQATQKQEKTTMNIKTKAAAAVLAATIGASSSSATTVAWYHFNEGANGYAPTGYPAIVTNSVAPGTLTGRPYWQAGVMAFGGAAGANSPYLPTYTNAFPTGVTWCDPVTGMRGDDGRGMYFRTAEGNGGGNGGGVLVTDDARLHCQHITVECMAKVALEKGTTGLKNWTHLLVMRNADQASTPSQTKNIKAWGFIVNTSGNLVVQLQVPKADGSGADTTLSTPDMTTSGVNLADGKWHHLAMTYDGQNVRVYLDYVLKINHAWAGPIYYGTPSKNRLCIGTCDSASYGRWQGFIDEVRISNEALPPEKFLRICDMAGTAASDADTAVYLPFNSMDAIADKFFFNSACSTNASKIDLKLSTFASGAYPRLDTGTESVVAPTLHAGIFATNSFCNPGCWTYTNNFAYPEKSRQVWIDDYTRNGGTHLISSGDFTAECFLNISRTPVGNASARILYENSGSKGISTMYIFSTSSYLRFGLVSQESFDKYESGTASSVEEFTRDVPISSVADGSWHHVAIVVDRTNRAARYYVDGNVVGSITNFTLASQLCTYKNSSGEIQANWQYLKIGDGGDGNNAVAIHDMSIDEFRITRRALAPQEFLMAGSNGTTDLEPVRAFVRFEENLEVAPRANEIPAGSAGASIVYSSEVPGIKLLDRDNPLDRVSNTRSMKFSGNGRAFFDRNILLERDMESQTVEFFMKGERGAATAWAYFARMYSNINGAENGGERVWSIGYRNNNGAIYVCMDNASGNHLGYPDDSQSLADGRWHHIAMTFEPDGKGDTIVKVYKDYRPFGQTLTFKGVLLTSGSLGYSCVALGNGFNGYIDEFRVSKGVLDVSEMLHVQKPGMLITIR